MKQRVLLKGADGIDLLHRMSTIDLKHPKTNEKTVGLILNPQGKIRSYFTLLMKSADEAELEFSDSFLEILDQFTFGEKYEITKLPEQKETAPSEKERILALTPKWDAEFKSNGEINPLEVNLRSAVHDQKGCYPGQEVIEKVISLGSPSKRLCLLEGTLDKISLPLTLHDSKGAEAGTLTSYSQGVGLGIIKRTFLKENETLFAGTQPLVIRKIAEL